MPRRALVSTEIVDNYTSVHPALDFWATPQGARAIVSVGEQVRLEYDNGDIEFKEGEYTILNNGDAFVYSKRALADRRLYYARGLDLPLGRWEHRDIVTFCEETKNGGATITALPELYSSIKGLMQLYMDYQDERFYDVFSAFIIYTYFYPLFNNAPILQLWGEQKTGKSKTCKLLASLCFNPVNSSNISEASVFRLVEGRRATLLLDESEDLMNSERGKAICNLLLAGYNKSGETFRQEKVFNGERYKTMSYHVFSPKVIANIVGVNLSPLLSRTIRFIATGARDKSKANLEINDEDVMFKGLRNRLFRYMLTCFPAVIAAKENLPSTIYQEKVLNDRTFGIWEGMLSIASLISPEVYQNVLSYAHHNSKEMQEEMDNCNIGFILMKKLYTFTETYGDQDITVGQLYAVLRDDEDLNLQGKRQLGDLMKRVGFTTLVKRENLTTHRYYNLKNEEIVARLSRL